MTDLLSRSQYDTSTTSASLEPEAAAQHSSLEDDIQDENLLSRRGNRERTSFGLKLFEVALQEHKRDQEDGDGGWHRRNSGSALTDGEAGVQLFLRLHHARQTCQYVQAQMSRYCTGPTALRIAKATVWEALDMLGSLREYEAVLMGQSEADATLSLRDHALQSAELCRAAFPDRPELHLAGLLHSLGKLLAHPRWGSAAQWQVCGESFPVGCAFSSLVKCSAYFCSNGDTRKPQYRSLHGVYRPYCGLDNVDLCWSAAEYLYTVLVLNGCSLPPGALYVIRYQKFYSLRLGAYAHLCDAHDASMRDTLLTFQDIIQFRRRPVPSGLALDDPRLLEYYSQLIARYIPRPLHF